MELGLDSRISKIVDDTRGEVCIAVRRYNESKVHEASHDDFVVFEDVFDITKRYGSLKSAASLVDLKACFDVSAFLFGKPFCVFGKICEKEEEKDGDDAGQDAFEDEDPAPAPVTTQTIHLTNSARELC